MDEALIITDKHHLSLPGVNVQVPPKPFFPNVAPKTWLPPTHYGPNAIGLPRAHASRVGFRARAEAGIPPRCPRGCSRRNLRAPPPTAPAALAALAPGPGPLLAGRSGAAASETCGEPRWPWVKTNGIPFWLVGEFTTHFGLV